MRIEREVLLATPMLVLGGVALFFILLPLALARNRWRIPAGLLGAVAGYTILGADLACRLAENAMRNHECPDAGWIGPATGELSGAVVAVVSFNVGHFVSGRVRGRDDPEN